MEQVNFGYSTKNIPVPKDDTYLQLLTAKWRKFAHNARKEAFHFLKKTASTSKKETYGFKSTNPASSVALLKPFEDAFTEVVMNVKFGRKPNVFQQHIKQDVMRINSENRPHIKGDKSSFYYIIEAEQYNKLVDKEIHKEYKIASDKVIENIDNSQKQIVKDLDLSDRVFVTTQRQAFATLKDHKENFHSNPKVRLINPAKPETGIISKKILEKINFTVREKSGLQQWQNTSAVVNWFKNIEDKNAKTFIKFDVVSFYPSITKKLFKDAIAWARQFVEITEKQEHIMVESKNSLLFKDGKTWTKKGDSSFDVAQGSYDGAETCELVGLFVLDELSKIRGLDVGLYRDDGLGVTRAPPRQAEIIRKRVVEVCKKFGLSTTSSANSKREEFLDVFFDLENDSFRPYLKPNNVPQYVHKMSNHPPAVLKNIPEGVNKRLSSISSNEEMFETAAPIYREALARSGYDYQLRFNPEAANPPKKKRKRSRKILWFNPPFSLNVKTNIAKEFLKLIDRFFPPGHPLRQIFNRNRVKVSYSCTPNMEAVISRRNKMALQQPTPPEELCNCGTKVCPLGGQCLSKNIVYEAKVTQENGTQNFYTGLSSTTFKERLGVHRHSFKNRDDNQTALSKFIWALKDKGLNYEVSWRLLARGNTFCPVAGVCWLCIKEKFYILFRPNSADINSRDEILENCRHVKSKLLIHEKKKRPG